MLNRNLTFLFLFLFSLVNAQDEEFSLDYNPELIANPPKKMDRSMAKGGGMIELPFVDDFSQDHFIANEEENTVLWLDRYVYLNNTWAINPPTIGVASFDGVNEVGYPYDWSGGSQSAVADTLTSAPINLNYSASADIGLSFYYQPGGLGYLPEVNFGDSLTLEFYAPELDQWFPVWSTNEGTIDDFEFVYIPIVLDRYLQENFQFRFKNYTQLNGALDSWHIDYVWLDQNLINQDPVNNDVAFVRQESTLLTEYTSMPWEHYLSNPNGFVRSDISLLLRNLNDGPRTLEDNNFEVLYENASFHDYNNPNNPQIAAQSILEYQYPIELSPNNFIFSADNDTSAAFEVLFHHGVADFDPTSSNDTMRFIQHFSNYYAYDDASAEKGYWNQVSGENVALRFVNHQADSIWAADIFFIPMVNDQEEEPFVLTLWEDGGNGPGDIIAEAFHTIEYSQEDANDFISYKFDQPLFLPAGNFYLGYRQPDMALSLGLDKNRNMNDDRLYYSENGGWFSSSISGTVMIRAMMQTLDYNPNAVDEIFLEDLSIFPNPGSSYVQLSSSYIDILQIQVYDISGSLIKTMSATGSSQLDISDLNPGMYILRISDEKGQLSKIEKLIIEN